MSTAERDYANLEFRYRSYVRAKGRRGPEVDDLVQLMLLDAFEHPDTDLKIDYVYLHAVDALDPRVVQDGATVRTSQSRRQALSLDAPLSPDGDRTRHDTLASPARPPEEDAPWLPREGHVRAMLTLYAQGYTLKDLGTLFGVTESRVCQIFAEQRRRAPKARLCHRCRTRPPRRKARYCAACRKAARDDTQQQYLERRAQRRADAPGVEVDWALRMEVGAWLTL